MVITSSRDEIAWQRLRDGLRPGQREIADWAGGPLAVSAVPGAGKSTGMARAAALTIARFQLDARRQLAVVTFTRSAAAHLKAKIRESLQILGLPRQGFTVQTLHGLALQIAGRNPELSGMERDRTLVSPDRQHRLIANAVDDWITQNPSLYGLLLEGLEFDGEEAERLRRLSVLRTDLLPELMLTVVREAKSSGLKPADLQHMGQAPELAADRYPGLAIAAGLYEAYEAQLQRRNAIDYDDMILAALRVLADPEAASLWRSRIFAVFEDEAQDSSPLQARLLEQLAIDPATNAVNLVRVGDPNQAINSSFTPADPVFFRRFCEACRSQGRFAQMDRSGRSSLIILEAANVLVQWTNDREFPRLTQQIGTRSALPPFELQCIQPAEPNDPQPNANPTPLGLGLELVRPADIHQSIAQIGQRAIDLWAKAPDLSLAVLVRTNDQGRWVAKSLGDRFGDRLNLYEVGASDRQSHVPGEMLTLLQFLDRPHSPQYLKALLRVLVDRQRIPTQDLDSLAAQPEQFLYPGPLDPPLAEPARQARRICAGILAARLHLPHYALLSFLAMTLGYDRAELATTDKLIETLVQRDRGDQRLETTLNNLAEIVSNETFAPVEAEELPESPYTRPGQLTIITAHKAKGLDWDGVFLPFLHSDYFSTEARVPLQMEFLGAFNLGDCLRAQIRDRVHGAAKLPPIAIATHQARWLKVAEEYRLLYVAMTRAKRLLWMAAEQQAPFTWNKPENLTTKTPCPAFLALETDFPECKRSAP
ncbi:MAG: ATP-dependent helicase [Limnothrix sp.]|nr:ATP-dependent helicase [Limnothrix sp.]